MSFNIALSGINAINTELDAISNNIANAGTYGFKSSRANFAAEPRTRDMSPSGGGEFVAGAPESAQISRAVPTSASGERL